MSLLWETGRLQREVGNDLGMSGRFGKIPRWEMQKDGGFTGTSSESGYQWTSVGEKGAGPVHLLEVGKLFKTQGLVSGVDVLCR